MSWSDMNNQDPDYAEASTSNHSSRRHQAREYRRRLLRSSRTMTAAPEAQDDEQPQPQSSTSPDARWTFQTPEGHGQSFLSTPNT